MARYSGEIIARTSLEIRGNLALLDRLISFGLDLAFFSSGPIVKSGLNVIFQKNNI